MPYAPRLHHPSFAHTLLIITMSLLFKRPTPLIMFGYGVVVGSGVCLWRGPHVRHQQDMRAHQLDVREANVQREREQIEQWWKENINDVDVVFDLGRMTTR
jgi:hypothetical protein